MKNSPILSRPIPYSVPHTFRFAALGLIALSAACARIEPKTNPTLSAFSSLGTSASASALSPVYVTSDYLVKKKHHPKLSASLADSLSSELLAQGYTVTDIESQAATKVNCTVSTWPGYGGNTDLITLLTLGMYTPFHYPWLIEAEVTDGKGSKLAEMREKGMFEFYSIGTIFLHIPTAIVFTTAVPAKRRELGENAAKMIVVKVADIGLEPARNAAAPEP